MTDSKLVEEIAKIIEPQLFAIPPESFSPAYHRFVENTKAKAREILALVEKVPA